MFLLKGKDFEKKVGRIKFSFIDWEKSESVVIKNYTSDQLMLNTNCDFEAEGILLPDYDVAQFGIENDDTWIKDVLILVVALETLNVKWLYQPSTDTHFSIAQSISTDVAEKQFLTLFSIKDTCNYYINHKFTTACDIVTNYGNTVVVKYKGNNYKVFVKDGNNYNNVSRADITFKATTALKDYKVIDIKPIEVN